MKKQFFNTILFTMLMSIVETDAFGYDIEVKNDDGVTIYYNYTNDGKELEVTNNGSRYCYSGALVIPEEVTYMNRIRQVKNIKKGAFSYCDRLISVTIPNSVTSIEELAFYECSKLISVTIPSSVISIGNSAFENCSSLKSITIPNSLKSIAEYTFLRCSDLTSVTIPSSVTSIGFGAFSGCSSLISITIPNSVTSIGGSAFYSCTSLTSVTIPNSLTSIDSSVFQNCTSLISITIPNSVTSIGGSAFYSCTSLTSVTIPNRVTTIGDQAFNGCKNVTSIISLIENPFEIIGKSSNSRTFDLDIFNNVTLYVPTGTVEKYKATKGWNDFLFIEEGTDPDGGGGTPETKKCATPTIGYKNGKLIFDSETDAASYHYSICDDDIKSGNSNEVQLSVTYHISVYATKTGYENSDVVTATLCWIDMEPKTEGITDGIANVRARAVLIQSSGNMLTVYGADESSTISVFDIAGRLVGFAKVLSEATNISTSLRIGDLGVVKIGDNTVKVLMK